MASTSTKVALTEAKKPVFGPPCSPEIFSRKWLTKTHALWSTFGIQVFHSQHCTGHPEFISQALDLALAFNIEAEALNLVEDSMPERDEVADLVKLRSPVGHTFKNPFTAMDHLATFVNTMRKEWEGEQSGELLGPYAWITHPQEYRTACEHFVAKVNEAVKHGLWDAEKGLPEDFEKFHRDVGKSAWMKAKYGN